MGKGKRKPGKALVSIAGIAAALIVIAMLLLMYQLGTIVKTAVEKVGPSYTGGPVRLASVSIRPFTGTAVLKGLAIGNPAGFRATNAFELAKLEVDLNVRSIFGDPLVIRNVTIDGPKIVYETANRKGNIDTILKNVNKGAARKPAKPAPPAGTPPPAPKAPKPEKHVVIDRLVISNGEVSYKSGLTGKHPIPLALPTITMTDIGKSSATTVSEALAQVMGEIINGIGTAFAKSFTAARKGQKPAAKRLDELAEDSNSIAEDAAKGIGRAADDVTDAARKGLQKLGLDDWMDKKPGHAD